MLPSSPPYKPRQEGWAAPRAQCTAPAPTRGSPRAPTSIARVQASPLPTSHQPRGSFPSWGVQGSLLFSSPALTYDNRMRKLGEMNQAPRSLLGVAGLASPKSSRVEPRPAGQGERRGREAAEGKAVDPSGSKTRCRVLSLFLTSLSFYRTRLPARGLTFTAKAVRCQQRLALLGGVGPSFPNTSPGSGSFVGVSRPPHTCRPPGHHVPV